MSDAPTPRAPRKKGGLVRKLLLFVAAPAVLIGGGIGGGLYAAGKGVKHGPAEDPNRPKLMLKGSGEHGTPDKGPVPAHVDPARYQATYFPIEQSFTSNLRDTDGFLQLGLGVSTFYDGKVIEHLKAADMPVRSAVLETLAQQSAEAINTPAGKAKLRRDLRDAINRTLTEHEGFGGVDSVYFTSFIIQ